MLTIWKFPLKPGFFKVSMPKGARVLSVQTQRTRDSVSGEAMMWALCDDSPTTEKELRDFLTLGTGHDASAVRNMRFVGTFQLDDGALVFHLFEGSRYAGE